MVLNQSLRAAAVDNGNLLSTKIRFFFQKKFFVNKMASCMNELVIEGAATLGIKNYIRFIGKPCKAFWALNNILLVPPEL